MAIKLCTYEMTYTNHVFIICACNDHCTRKKQVKMLHDWKEREYSLHYTLQYVNGNLQIYIFHLEKKKCNECLFDKRNHDVTENWFSFFLVIWLVNIQRCGESSMVECMNYLVRYNTLLV